MERKERKQNKDIKAKIVSEYCKVLFPSMIVKNGSLSEDKFTTICNSVNLRFYKKVEINRKTHYYVKKDGDSNDE